jgi:hypothetical protein
MGFGSVMVTCSSCSSSHLAFTMDTPTRRPLASIPQGVALRRLQDLRHDSPLGGELGEQEAGRAVGQAESGARQRSLVWRARVRRVERP